MMYEQKAAELRRRGFKAARTGQFEEALVALFESPERDQRSANRRTKVAQIRAADRTWRRARATGATAGLE